MEDESNEESALIDRLCTVIAEAALDHMMSTQGSTEGVPPTPKRKAETYTESYPRDR